MVTWIAGPFFFSIHYVLSYLVEFYSLGKLGAFFLMLIGVFPSILFIYVFIPFVSIVHGIQGLYRKDDQLTELTFFRTSWLCNFCIEKELGETINSHENTTFVKLFEQFGEALPQLLIALTFYVNHKYFVDTNDSFFQTNIPVTLISMIFSSVSVVIGLITGLKAFKSYYDEGFNVEMRML